MNAGYNPRTNKLAQRKTRERFVNARKKGKVFERQLVAVAKQVGHIISGFAPEGVIGDLFALQTALDRYAAILTPWARQVSEQMIAEINQRDKSLWLQMGKEIGEGLRQKMYGESMEFVMIQLRNEQVELITSLSTKASERVGYLATEAVISGSRGSEIEREILNSSNVTVARARMIARTEIARTQSTLNATRAQELGATQYIWRTSSDSDVRELHHKLANKVFNYDDPPITGSNGERSLPGCIYNCRCFAEPILPD